MKIFKRTVSNAHKFNLFFILINLIIQLVKCESKIGVKLLEDLSDASLTHSKCCEETMIIDSSLHPEGYLKEPPIYEKMNEPKNAKRNIECLYKFYGKPNERIQLFYEDFQLYYPHDIYKFNKIDCRYADSICLKFYERKTERRENKDEIASKKTESISLETHNYDLCNCINVSYTPRQIMSAGNFLEVRFKSVHRSYESSANSLQSRTPFRGYLIRYRFTQDFGLENREGGQLNTTEGCKIFFNSRTKRSGYFASPNYPGLYPREIECHYYFIGQKYERIQITFHTFDVEGVDQCTSDTKSDFVELSNFQNKDRIFSRFCGVNKPGAILSDSSFFHVTFYSNNVFDGKGFQASYYFVNFAVDPATRNAAANTKTPVSSVVSVNAKVKSDCSKLNSTLALIYQIFAVFILKFIFHIQNS